MGKRQPSIFITEGQNAICRYCRIGLTYKVKTFELVRKKKNDTQEVTEKILFCPECERYYVTQKLSYEIVRKYPGYYIDVAQYSLKSKKMKKDKPLAFKEKKPEMSAQYPILHGDMPQSDKKESQQVDEHKTMEKRLNSPVFLSNAHKYRGNICPKCSSVLGKEKVNIPILKEDGDFFRYHTEIVSYCYNCKKGYIDKKTIISVLSSMQRGTKRFYRVELGNARIQRDARSMQYLDYPTLDLDEAIYHPGIDDVPAPAKGSDKMNLSTQSFLGKMGYAVGESAAVRHQILVRAVKQYGKRRVTDHLAFLVDTRRGQVDGDTKYAKAIAVWQNDMNYVFRLQLE